MLQVMERDDWHDLALFPFEENDQLALERARTTARAIANRWHGMYRIEARRGSGRFADGDVLWSS